MNKFSMNDTVKVAFEGLLNGKLIILWEEKTIYGIIKNFDVDTYEYLVKKNPMEDGEWVLENKISKMTDFS